MLIDIVVYDGVDELDVVGPLEVLRDASRRDPSIGVRLASTTRTVEVRGAYGLSFAPDHRWRPGDADVVVVPGGGWAARAPRGAWAECRQGWILEQLAVAAASARVVVGVCTGTMLLAHAGVVGVRRATTHHAVWDELEATGATLVRQRVVDDGDLLTCGGVTSGIDAALWLVAREVSDDCAAAIADRLEHPFTVPRAGGR